MVNLSSLFNSGGRSGVTGAVNPTVAPWLQGLSLQDLQGQLSGLQGQQSAYDQSINPWRQQLGQKMNFGTISDSFRNTTAQGRGKGEKYLQSEAKRLGIAPDQFDSFKQAVMGAGDNNTRQSQMSDIQRALAFMQQGPQGQPQQPGSPQIGVPTQPSGPGGVPGAPGGQPTIGIPSTPGSGQFGGFDPGQLSNNPLRQWTTQIGQQLQNGSITNFNKAAGRLRERLDSAGAASSDQITNANVGRGFGFSGVNDTQQQRARADTQSAYGAGLVGLENAFEGQRQSGLQGALNATNQLFGNDQFSQDLAGKLFMNQENNRQSGANAALGANSDFLRSIFGSAFGR